jgi:hypothetical protein
MWLEKKILVATDFGELSETVCKAGLELARQFHVPLVVMHAYAPPAPTYSGAPLLPPKEYRELVENAALATLDKEAAPSALAFRSIDCVPVDARRILALVIDAR